MWCVAIPNAAEADALVAGSSLERENSTFPSSEPATTPEFFDCDPYCEFVDAASASESLLSSDVTTDFLLFDDSSQFSDADTDMLCPLEFEGDEFFDPVPEPDPTAWLHPPPHHWFYRLFFSSLFSLTTLFWDSLIYFWTAPRRPTLPRRYRRLSRIPTRMLVFPMTWMLMGNCVMMFASAYQGGPPMHPIAVMKTHTLPRAYTRIETTFDRMRQLETMVELNFETWIQLSIIKHRQFQEVVPRRPTPMQVEQLISEKELETFFDTYEKHPQHIEAFFDADFEEPESPDFLAVFDICTPRTLVDCCHAEASQNLLNDLDILAHGPTTAATNCMACNSGPDTHRDLLTFGTVRHAIIFDTGASLGITHCKDDFDGPLTVPEGDLRLGGMAQGMLIEGIGPVTYTFRNKDGSEVSIRSNCYYVPQAKVRLISPQRLFNKAKGVGGSFSGNEDEFHLTFDGCPTLTIEYDERNHLPIGYGVAGANTPRTVDPHANLVLLDESNQNITSGQKLLLQWHYRFGHLNLPRVQGILRNFPFDILKFASAGKCDTTTLRCSICQYAKGHRRPTHGTTTKLNAERDGALTAEHLGPGTRVSVDHFESRLLGRTFDSYGKASSAQYKGGCIFVDHGSGFLHVEHQLGFSAVETIRAKQSYEKMALDAGVVVQSYLTDSGAFKANAFVDHIRNSGQRIQYCGTNAHHQNGVAERSIRTVSNMTRALILHAAAHWPQGIDSSQWPMAVSHAVHIFNHTPDSKGICPADVYTGTLVPRHRLKDYHTWGCPVYVLDPSLQSGQKLPRWQPRSRLGVFMGLSTIHSSEVPLVLNTTTGSITSQYHVVFDDEFSTVKSIERETEPPPFWDDLCLENTTYIPVETPADQPAHLSDDWLNEEERIVKLRNIARREEIRGRLDPVAKSKVPTVLPLPTPSPVSPAPVNEIPQLVPAVTSVDPIVIEVTPPAPPPPPLISPVSRIPEQANVKPPPTAIPASRRSERTNRGTFSSKKFFDEVFLTPLDRARDLDRYTRQLVYLSSMYVCHDTGLENITDPRMYLARSKTKKDNPDMPSFQQAMHGPDADKWIKAMQFEVATLVQQNTWTPVQRTKDMNVLKGTWAFKLKRLPDGTPTKFKARFCARGDLQQAGVDFFDTYAPVVQWSTI